LLLIGDRVSEIANHAKEMQSDLIVVGHCLQKKLETKMVESRNIKVFG
jgi:hypothetical protein